MAVNSWLFELRGEIPKKFKLILGLGGIFFFLAIWAALTSGTSPLIPPGILPHPIKVFRSFGELLEQNDLIRNTLSSYALNLGGYFKALLWSIPIGFLIGLIPLFRGSMQQLINALRFVPLTAVTSIFIVWFGIYTEMKMNFLAFGIIIYLLPTIIQRIDEVEDVFLTTVHTLGANKWQTITTVYLPAVLSKLSDDIRVLTAISWTYIIVIENIGGEGGIGFLLYGPTARQARVDKLFALLILIMVIGILQDRFFAYLDRKFFPHKYQTKDPNSGRIIEENVTNVILDYVFLVIGYAILGIYVILALNEFIGFLGDLKPLNHVFGDRVWAIHLFFGLIIFYILRSLFIKAKK